MKPTKELRRLVVIILIFQYAELQNALTSLFEVSWYWGRFGFRVWLTPGNQNPFPAKL
jgi:hypothetical protein